MLPRFALPPYLSQRVVSATIAIFLAVNPAFADRVSLLVDDQSRFQAHVRAARGTQRELDVAFAFIHDDPVTRRFLAELIETARRSKVRLLLDSFGSKLDSDLVAYLIHNGVEVRYFHAVTSHPATWNRDVTWIWRRMHDKLVVSDGSTMVTGTENMGAPYYRSLAAKAPKAAFRGRNIEVTGETAAEAGRHFDRVWNSREVNAPHFSIRLKPEAWEEQARLFREAQAHPFPEAAPGRQPIEFEIDAKDLRFLTTLDDGRVDSPRALKRKIIELIKVARREIIIETPYLLPDREIADLLVARAREGISVILLTNSSKSNNHRSGGPLYRSEIARLAARGIEVREWTGEETNHGKTVLVDDELVLVTTYNLNRRSHRHDHEIGVWARDARLAAAVKRDLAMEKFAVPPPAGLARRCLRGVLNFLLRPVAGQY